MPHHFYTVISLSVIAQKRHTARILTLHQLLTLQRGQNHPKIRQALTDSMRDRY